MVNCRHHIVIPVPLLDTVPTVHVPLAVPHHPDSDRCGSDGLELFSLIAGKREKPCCWCIASENFIHCILKLLMKVYRSINVLSLPDFYIGSTWLCPLRTEINKFMIHNDTRHQN